MKAQGKKKLPGVGFKKLKKILKRCRKEAHFDTVFDDHHINGGGGGISHTISTCPQHCSGIYVAILFSVFHI